MLTVHLAVYDTLADWEPAFAVAEIANPQMQREPGRYAVRTVGPTTAPVVTMGGVRILPDLALADLDPAESALLILPGAQAWDDGDGARLQRFAAQAGSFLDAGTPVAAICGATAGLARAGLLDDRPHTSSAPEYLAATGYAGADAYVAAAPVVRDGDLITASPVAAAAFAREIFALLDLYDEATLDAWAGMFT